MKTHLSAGRVGDQSSILVTGGAGFIGSTLVASLLRSGASVWVVDDLSTGVRSRLPAESDRFHFMQGSILDEALLRDLPANLDAVFHLASVVGMERATRDPDYALLVSDRGTANVLAATGDTPAVLFSSSSVYGLHSAGISRESDRLSWEGVLDYDGGRPGYACGKLLVERHGQRVRAAGRGVLTVRPFNVVGPGQLGSYGMVVPRFVAAALTGEPIVVYGDGQQARSFSHISTFINRLIEMLQRPAAWSLESPVNLGAPSVTRIIDLADTVVRETGSTSPITFMPYEKAYPGKHDVRHRLPATEIASSLLGPIEWPSVRDIVVDVIRTTAPSAVLAGADH